MNAVSVNQFRSNLKKLVDESVTQHVPLKVTRRGGDDFIVMSVEDWEREQETLYVLQNQNLMQQIAKSAKTFENQSGYKPSPAQLDEIFGI